MAEAAVLTRLARLVREARPDREALAARADEIQTLLAVAAWNRAERVLLAANLHGYYTALETLLERAARLMDELVPTGAGWHSDLLEQMRVEVPGLRPALLPDGVLVELHALRKFRHFFRNAYVLEFDERLLREHAERVGRVAAPIAAQLDGFVAHVTAMLARVAVD